MKLQILMVCFGPEWVSYGFIDLLSQSCSLLLFSIYDNFISDKTTQVDKSVDKIMLMKHFKTEF